MAYVNYHREKKHFIRKWLRHYAPDYAWTSARDLFLMCEQQYEDVDYNCFIVTLCWMKRQGHFAAKPSVHRQTERGKIGHLYLWITPRPICRKPRPSLRSQNVLKSD